MPYSISYIDIASRYWGIAEPGRPKTGVWMAAEALEGLVSQGEDSTEQAVGRAGVLFSGTAIEAMEGTLRVHVRRDDHRPINQVYREWRAGWSRREAGTLVVDGGSYGPVSCKVRLAEWIGPPMVDPYRASDVELEIALRADEGVWWTHDSEYTGTATVTNSGIAYMCPRIRWTGNGGKVTLPSGATFTLPKVTAEKTLYLDANESMVVLNQDLSVDGTLWSQLAGTPPEGVAAGQSAVYQLPANATLLASTALDSPWQ